ncbi:hypothetical protein BIY24_07200 [Halobacteriovorax marinus]|uniref:trypsin-like serine peptidase n=1 Tax=Halobacteriovorax marinus TaxID=97084 RepID=UPI000BC31118|nr:serine protease [Halobacteriovorax marinus]ATH07738.1 hypothetical protein BIY24_07200 [Halobacteriovorax marinus]
MTFKRCFSVILFIYITISSSFADAPKVVYGIDNRVESEEFSDQRFSSAASSVAGMVWNKKLTQSQDNSEVLNFKKLSMQLYYNVCKEERFSDQIPLPTCTAFLVGPDLLLTAGHCINDETQCKQNTWIFDYTKGTQAINKDNAYSCKKLIDRKLNTNTVNVKDYALIQLDREVTNREPLKLRRDGKVKRNTPLIVIGHPVGLPLKIADGAKVSGFKFSDLIHPITSLKKRKNYFVTNTDTYIGNSGSPVFNEETGDVEGILIQGKKDFYYTGEDCLRSIHYKNKSKESDEKVFRILKVDNLEQEIQKSYERHNR